MTKRNDDERVQLARWLMVNAHRLSKRQPRTRILSDIEARWRHSKNLLWTAAAKLREIEGTE
jgi:hypothetical protein